MIWVWLLASIVCEVIGTTMLKLASEGGKHAYWYSAGVMTFYIACFALLGVAMKHFSLGVVYATWSGLGVSLLAMIGIVFFGDEINPLKVFSFLLIIVGVIGLNMSGMSH